MTRSATMQIQTLARATDTCSCLPAVWNKTYRQGGTEFATALGFYPTGGDVANVSNVTPHRIDAALAGFVLLSIFNTILLAVLGTAPTVAATAYNNQEVRSTRGAPVGTGAVAAPYATTAGAPVSAGAPVAGAGQTVV